MRVILARPVYLLAVNKWYFDELIDMLIVRPALAVGHSPTGSSSGSSSTGWSAALRVVREGGRLVRAVQSGFVRAYALLLIAGFAGLGLYFLIV